LSRERIVKPDAGRDRADPAGTPRAAGTPEQSSEARVPDLRPRSFDEYVGQREVVDSLLIAVTAARQRGETVDHVLLHGPPGLGKTTLAHIIAREMTAALTHTSGPALERPADVVGVLSNLGEGDVLFIDEIHRLSHAVEEYLYSAMEEFQVDFVTGSGAYAKTLSFPLKRFTLVGATTRAGLLSAPLRDRFGLTYHMEYYSEDDLARVVLRSARILGIDVPSEAADEIARRARATPRIANRLLRRVRDYSEVNADGEVSPTAAAVALELEGVDELGLDRLDRLYLRTLVGNYNGGPAGIEALSATINEETQTLVDVVEPYLLKIGFIVRTPAGRRATPLGITHTGDAAAGSAGQQPLLM